jgi:hypothetical protein
VIDDELQNFFGGVTHEKFDDLIHQNLLPPINLLSSQYFIGTYLLIITSIASDYSYSQSDA